MRKTLLWSVLLLMQVPIVKADALSSPEEFPIGVWLQDARNAAKYKEVGINLYVGLWKGPTEAQLKILGEVGMEVICHQNVVGLKSGGKTIVGWMHGDEPDNAQSLGEGKGYGPPIAPERIVEDYRRIKAADPTRPVLLNLGQGVAWDNWHGRGVRTRHPEDYPKYIAGCDIVSFDIYPVTHGHAEVSGQLWYVAYGVERLRKWSEGKKPVWACIECTRIGGEGKKPTPGQVRSEVWMAIIHGADGIVYFCHEFKPRFVEAGMLADPEMAKGVGRINKQIRELAPILKGEMVEGAVAVRTDGQPVDVMVKKGGGATYVFAAAMREKETRATFELKGLAGRGTAEVLGEDRRIEVVDGRWEDAFAGYGVHLYRVSGR